MDLELLSTDALIAELCRRRSFAGIILYKDQEVRDCRPAEVSCNKVRWSSNFTSSKVLVQLANASDCLKQTIEIQEKKL